MTLRLTSRHLVLFIFTLSSILGTGIADASSSTTRILMPPSPIEAGKHLLLGARSALDVVSRRTRVPLSKMMPSLPLPKQTPSTTALNDPVLKPLSYYLRVGLAGGLAGATGTTILYPMDSAKTLRQSNPELYASVKDALIHLLKSRTTWHVSHAYRGIIPAALGAIPSSALYFGTYESAKVTLQRSIGKGENNSLGRRLAVHGLAAACGNMISSAVFVPKELIKQQLQYHSEGKTAAAVVVQILQEKGIPGLYRGYQATLMRNIPSAMLRFVLYEELKRVWAPSDEDHLPIGLFAAGAVAGAMASGIMTPVDVMKTRLATGTCPVGVKNCMMHVVKETGWKGLYAGAGSRMVWSGAFSAIGFGTFELVKRWLGVSEKQQDRTTEQKL